MSKRRFEEKIERLEQDTAQTRSDLAAAQIRLKDLEEKTRREECRSCGEDSCSDSETETHRQRIARHQKEISRYETRLGDMAKLLDLTGRSPRKVSELERSLSAMKEQQKLLKDQLRQESERKKKLQGELEHDHLRIVELERQLHEKGRSRGDPRNKNPLRSASALDDRVEPATELGDSQAESEREHKWRWLVAEEERLLELRNHIQCQTEELQRRQTMLDKRERALLSRSQNDDGVHPPKMSDPLIETVDPLPSSAGDLVKYPAAVANAENAPEKLQDKESVRKEIRNLRHTRDALVVQRQELDERQHRGRELSALEEHRLLELDEAIEAVDAAIEYKNEVICSRKHELYSPVSDSFLFVCFL